MPNDPRNLKWAYIDADGGSLLFPKHRVHTLGELLAVLKWYDNRREKRSNLAKRRKIEASIAARKRDILNGRLDLMAKVDRELDEAAARDMSVGNRGYSNIWAESESD